MSARYVAVACTCSNRPRSFTRRLAVVGTLALYTISTFSKRSSASHDMTLNDHYRVLLRAENAAKRSPAKQPVVSRDALLGSCQWSMAQYQSAEIEEAV